MRGDTLSAQGKRDAMGRGAQCLSLLLVAFLATSEPAWRILGLGSSPAFASTAGESSTKSPTYLYPGRRAVGTARVSGQEAWVNNSRLVSGTTLFALDHVRLGERTTAALQLPGELVLVAGQTELVLREGAVSLEKGRIQLRQAAGSALEVDGAYFQVRLGSRGEAAAEVEVNPGGAEPLARIEVLAGVAEVRATGDPANYRVRAGEAAVLEMAEQGAAPATGNAGHVARVVPQVMILRGPSAGAGSEAAPQSPVLWNDELRSGRGGRARVELNDGSVLNLGSASSLRVLQHDASAQQTELDLVYGQVRCRVVPLTRPGAKFQVRTRAAVAGLVGTDFYLLSTDDFTELIVFDGQVRLTSLQTGQSVLVQAGMKLILYTNGTASGPSPATPEEVQQAVASTDVPEEHSGRRGGFWTGLGSNIVVSVGAIGSVTIIGLYLDHRQPVSPSAP